MRIAGVLGADGVNATGDASFCSVVSEIRDRKKHGKLNQYPTSIAQTVVISLTIDRILSLQTLKCTCAELSKPANTLYS